MRIIPLLAVDWQQVTGWLALLDVILIAVSLLSILSLKKNSISAVAWIITVVFLGTFTISPAPAAGDRIPRS